MEKLIDDIWGAPGMSNTCVFLSTLLPNKDSNGIGNRLTINDQFRRLVSRRAGDKCIYLAEMGSTKIPADEIFKSPDDFCAPYFKCDDVHPNVS